MKDSTELVIILDRSGSMETGRADHEGGLRSFVRDQRKLPGNVCLTFVRFDSHNPFELVYDGTPLDDVDEKQLTLTPRGNTPLLAAVGMTLEHVAARLAKEKRKPDQTVVMVITDGQENASHTMERKFTREQVKKLIGDRETDGWKVLYLGANVDEFSEAAGLGVSAYSALGFMPTSHGIGSMYSALSCNVGNARAMYQASELAGLSGQQVAEQVNQCYNFSDVQRTSTKKIFDGTWDGTSKVPSTPQTKKNDEEPKPPTT